jgi:hypothetical protein
MKIFAQRVLQPGGAAIIFPKSGRNQNSTPLCLSIKKTFVTPKFCGQNFSQMHHFEDMNFLSPLDSLYLL